MSRIFIDRPILATVISLLITIAGAISLWQLPISRFPSISPPTVVVRAVFPGADAATVAQSVAAPIEEQVNGVANMLYMSSKSSNDGVYSLTITFDIGTSQDLAAVDVQGRLSVAQRSLPQQVVEQGIAVYKRSPQVMMAVTVESLDPRFDYLFLSNYATLHVVDALARIPGVGQAEIFGARDYGMRVWLDPEKMTRLGVTARDVIASLREQSVVAPAGTIGGEPAPPGQQLQYTVHVRGRLSTPEEFAAVVVRTGDDGALVRLGDLARVSLDATDYARSSRSDGRPVAMIGISQHPDANALDVSRRVISTMEELSKEFPPGIGWSIPFDTTRFVAESIREVLLTLSIAALLVLLVIYVFLESFRATVIPMLAVPVSLIGTFSVFLALGFSINTLTLFALVLAVGLVVDDAIVVVEAVMTKMANEDLSPRDATIAAMEEVSSPVIAIALVLSAVFVPVSFLGGLTGQFYRQFALTLSVSVLISAWVALSFTPALCVLLLRPPRELAYHGRMGRFFAAFDRAFERTTRGYVRAVRGSIGRARLVVAVFLAILAATWLLVETRPMGFLPSEDQGYVMGVIRLPAGASVQRTDVAVDDLRKLARAMPEVEAYVGVAGLSAMTSTNSSYTGHAFISLTPWDEREGPESSADGVIARLEQASSAGIADASILVVNPSPVPGIGFASGFEFVLEDRRGGSVEDFERVLQDLVARANARPELFRVFGFFESNVPTIEYELDREHAKSLGIPISEIFAALQTHFGGTYVNDFNLYGRTYRVTAQADAEARATPEAVREVYVRSADGAMVPLSTLVRVVEKQAPPFIERYNVYRATTIVGQAKPGFSSGEAVKAMEEVAAELPPGYGYEWTGTIYQQKKTEGAAPLVFAMALGFVFFVLAGLYESWAVPLAVILSIPLAAFGAFVGLSLRGMDNDVFAQIGLVMLIGLAAKNAILIVEFAKQAHARGAPLVEAAIEGARLRLRPILMTSLAFILGSLPLAFGTGAGAGSRNVLGTAVVFGMAAATFLGVLMIPVFYVGVQGGAERLQQAWRSRFGRRPPAA
ncbi:MAG: multidrug efflux RND transporter permease subunit [Deltaproteobacteria bacterium]|nr:multidrug efflux RND transporter permease subunit [Deltaproteobacteria bacterium]